MSVSPHRCVSLILTYMDHMGSDTVENFLTSWEPQGPWFWGGLLPPPVRASNSRAWQVPVAQEAPVAPHQGGSILVYMDSHTSPSCLQSRRGEGLCCPTSGCNTLHTDTSVVLCLEQEGKKSDIPSQISRKKAKSDSGRLWTQTQTQSLLLYTLGISHGYMRNTP